MRLTFLIVIVLGLGIAASAQGQTLTEAEQVKEFGTETSKPFTGDTFWFVGGWYIEAPYVIERRGLNLYLNGIFMETVQVSGWPPRDWTLKEDPGPPPAHVYPFDPPPTGATLDETTETYWAKKWRFLATQYPYEEAIEKLYAAYTAIPEVQTVTRLPGSPIAGDHATTTRAHPLLYLRFDMKDGTKHYIEYDYFNWQSVRGINQPTKADVAKCAKSAFSRLEYVASAPGIHMIVPRTEMDWEPRASTKLLGILLERKTNEEKIKQIHTASLDETPYDATQLDRVVEEFNPTPVLTERYQALKARFDKEVEDSHRRPTIPPEIRAVTRPTTRP